MSNDEYPLVDVTGVRVLARYVVELTFDDGSVRVIDLESGHREPARGLRCHAMHQAAFDLLIGGAAALTLFLATALDTL